MVTGDDVLAAEEICHAFLREAADANWGVPVPGLDFTVTTVLAHAADCPLWYAMDLWSGPSDDTAFELNVRADASNAALLATLRSASRVCAASVDAAPAETRGFHPAGSPDPSGFAAMACDELLVHTDDAARGLGLRFSPGPDVAGRVLARLFPWHDQGDDPWQTLLWANNRLDLPGRSSQKDWTWHCAPLSEWDGKAPALR